jgi:hypothetical protein
MNVNARSKPFMKPLFAGPFNYLFDRKIPSLRLLSVQKSGRNPNLVGNLQLRLCGDCHKLLPPARLGIFIFTR